VSRCIAPLTHFNPRWYGSLSEFINAAVEQIRPGAKLQQRQGLAAPGRKGNSPGKPRAARPAAVVSKEPAMPQKPAQDLVEIVEKLRREDEDGKKVITMTENHRDGSSELRYYQCRHPGTGIAVFTCGGVRWDEQDWLESKP
jgi:hypothetical protein